MRSFLLSRFSFKTAHVQTVFTFLALSIPLCLIWGRSPADIVMGLVTVGFLLRSFFKKDWLWIKTPWFKACLLAGTYLVLSALLADFDKEKAFVAAIGWFRFPLFTIGFITWILPQEKAQRYITPFLAILLSLVAIDTIWQFTFGTSLSGHGTPHYFGRLTGPFHKMVVGIFLAHLCWAVIGFYFGRSLEKGFHKGFFVLALTFSLLMAFTILISGERTALVLFLVCGFFFAIGAKDLRKIIFPIGSAVLVAIALLIFLNPTIHTRLVKNTLPYLENIRNSPYGAVWHNGFTAWKYSPVFGVGPNNFVPACEALGHQGGFVNERPTTVGLACVRHPHNIYLEWLAETGFVGLLLFLALIGIWSKKIKSNFAHYAMDIQKYYTQLGYVMTILSFVWPIASTMSFFTNWNAVLFWWILALALQEPKRYA